MACRTVQQHDKEIGRCCGKMDGEFVHDQRKDIFNALDWYHTDSLHAVEKDGKAVFVELLDGKWPTMEMPMKEAKKKFEKLQSITWLKLEAKQD